MVEFARMHLRGHQQYYGVSGNSGPLRAYFRVANRLLFQCLNRRSQRRSLTWKRFYALSSQGALLPTPQIVHNLYPPPTRMS
jgi:RNA-directed DNA polymerase